ncbi:MAG: ABC transporter permease [Tropicimonas sp.]|uniref:ABC transporter permease n=1 Tax=Tropicimonas sp. TaxID=2067044 RepID=UPI003A8A62AC
MTLAEALPPRASLWQRMIARNGRAKVCWTFGLLAAIVLLGLLAPVLPLQDPIRPNPLAKLAAPSWPHLFGTDHNGMDVFSRTLHAIRTDFALALSSVILGVLVGVPLGAISGYIGGRTDAVLTRMSEVIQGFPQILFGMAFFAATGNSLWNVVLVVAFYNIPVYAKMVRSVVVPLRDIDYVQAARVAGNRPMRVVFRHIVPNALTPVFAQLPLSCAYAVQMIAGLSFLGLGVPIPMPEWGSMIQVGASYMVFGKWWPSVFPGLALFLSVWLLNVTSGILQSLWERRA